MGTQPRRRFEPDHVAFPTRSLAIDDTTHRADARRLRRRLVLLTLVAWVGIIAVLRLLLF